jgi:hypothetical protein
VVVPVTGLGLAAAAVATVGAALVTVIEASPLIDPLVAATVAEPVPPGAVYKPEELIDPTPEDFDQLNVG